MSQLSVAAEFNEPPQVSIVLGSANSFGNTASLVQAFIRGLSQAGISSRCFDLNQFNIQAFDYDFANQDDDFLPLIDQLLSSSVIFFASPVYWYAPSAQLKTFIDRLSDLLKIEKPRGRQLRGKWAGIIATAADQQLNPSFQGMLEQTFAYLGMKNLGILFGECEDEAHFSETDPLIVELVEHLTTCLNELPPFSNRSA